MSGTASDLEFFQKSDPRESQICKIAQVKIIAYFFFQFKLKIIHNSLSHLQLVLQLWNFSGGSFTFAIYLKFMSTNIYQWTVW